ncbi:hypothetical protein BU25DRAFT_420806 [Macroventuria anomochaeta]|uniref:Uncharacterized protein n=1 Tax=Macroventuria anomochaeta TaxID=301207 RepID=A0ACB6S477_9PLEO|nr:uncharacterized protein BU25DRAFT_420806 [Macroventuria anomochaeta]KAF2628317.1 hypothetical protein BU25DRAFT_420806 [Macroventuria anomochaeta]
MSHILFSVDDLPVKSFNVRHKLTKLPWQLFYIIVAAAFGSMEYCAELLSSLEKTVMYWPSNVLFHLAAVIEIDQGYFRGNRGHKRQKRKAEMCHGAETEGQSGDGRGCSHPKLLEHPVHQHLEENLSALCAKLETESQTAQTSISKRDGVIRYQEKQLTETLSGQSTHKEW